MRQRAVDAFGFDFAEVAERGQLTFEGYEEGKISLDESLVWIVFHEKRSFSRKLSPSLCSPNPNLVPKCWTSSAP